VSILFALGATVLFAFVRNQHVPSGRFVTHLLGELGTWPGLLAFFFAGMSLHFYSDVVPRRPAYALLAAASLVAATYVGWLDAALPLIGTYLLFFFIFTRSRLNGIGQSTDLSFGIYLHSFWIEQVLVATLPSVFLHMPLRLFACALVLSAGVAFLSWTFVEEPAQRLTKAPAPKLAFSSP
jgi:peptidoglycan/LPS O-acetylase OafA/YrhL